MSAPRNDFAEFIGTYFARCRERAPLIEANAGKWLFEDLIPGLSDFDTRFFVSDAATAADWCRLSMEVGRVHLELARERRDWARNLEHLPGVNLTWSELFDPQLYFTEFSQWSFYHGDPGRLEAARRLADAHAWSAADERYHWKRIATYFGPYNRAIDPPINLGPWEHKYSLHSRLMHYLAPPVHSGVCLARKKTTPGKIDAFRQARGLFPGAPVMDLVLSLIERHYEDPRYLAEPGMTELDRALEDYLAGMAESLLESAPFSCPRRPAPAQLRQAVRDIGGGAALPLLFENIKFARLMKGRMWFYGQEVPWFDSPPLIRNELGRIRASFYETPLRLFARIFHGRELTAESALRLLEGDVFGPSEAGACRRFAEAADPECPGAELRRRALAIADVFDPFLHALEQLWKSAKARSATNSA